MASLKLNQTKWAIACASPDSSPVMHAVSELQKYLQQITGAEIALTRDAGNAPSEGLSVITLGLRADLEERDASCLPPCAEGFDGYAISVEGSEQNVARVVIGADVPIGAIYGAYDLLEKMGCRWFFPRFDSNDPEVVPSGDDAALNAGRWALASPFRYRVAIWASFIEQTAEELELQADWALKCRFNICNGSDLCKRAGMLIPGGGHSFGEFLKTEDYFEAHPEWFGLQNGKRQHHVFGGSQFCWSNAEARKAFVENFSRYIEQHPEIQWYGLFGGDGLPACQCEECKKLNPADWQILIVNEAIDRVEKISPDLRIVTAGAYAPVEAPPLKMRPDSRILCTWAHWGRHHKETYADPDYSLRKNIDAWCDIFESRIVPFQYYSDHFAEPWVAAPYASTINGDREYLLERKAIGYSNLLYPIGYWWNWALNNYMNGLCFYDQSLDAFDVIRDFAARYYGKKAGPLMEAYYMEWARNLDLAYHVRGGATDADRAALASQRKQYLEPAIKRARTDPLVSYRLAKLEKLHALAERLTEIQRLQQKIEALRCAGSLAKARDELSRAQEAVEETAKYVDQLIASKQGLIDPELLNFFYPRIRALIENEAKALEQGSKEKAQAEPTKTTPEEMVPEH